MKTKVWVEDITNNSVLRDVAAWLCSLVYAEMYSADTAPVSLYETVTDRAVDDERVLMAFTKEADSDDAVVLGSMTVRFGRDASDPGDTNLEFMKLFEPIHGTWAETDCMRFAPGELAEASRFALAPRCLEETTASNSLRLACSWQLFGAAGLLCMFRDRRQIFAILPRNVHYFLRSMGLSVSEVAGLRRTPAADDFAVKMPDYFDRKARPTVCLIDPPSRQCINPISAEIVAINSNYAPQFRMQE